MTPPPSISDRPNAGISLCVLGLLLFSLQDVIIKSFSESYSVLQIVFVRGAVSLLPILLAIAITSGFRGLRAYRPGLLLLRGFLSFAACLAYYLAIAVMPLAQVVTIVFSAPIFVTVLSALVLKESVGVRRWFAVLVGFVAIVVVVGPNGDFHQLASVLAVVAAITYSLSILVTRFIGPNDAPWTITLYSMLAFLIGTGLTSLIVQEVGSSVMTNDPSLHFLIRPWVVPTLRDGVLMLFLGINGAAAFYCLIKAYWVSPASAVAPFEYTYIIWAVILGYLVFSELPSSTTLLGVALLVASSYYIYCREREVRRWEHAGDESRPEGLGAASYDAPFRAHGAR